ncbi:MAG: hypothetical protein J6X18_09000 [Bacteroidales bacterium]|nr:hypothetical protein [Bacteroidales bacterium]
MLVTNTFLSKCNTICDGSLANTGLNPILQLYYGNMHTRGLIYFDESKVKSLYQDNTYQSLDNMRHVLKMWNVSDINVPGITKRFPDSELTGLRERATSYELLLLKVPMDWDQGRGFDFSVPNVCEGYRAYSEFGSNWYNATTDTKWEAPGVYSIGFIEDELVKEESSVIVARQHFDFGNEPLEMDITDIFNKFISGEEQNHGFLLMFTPALETKRTKFSQYSGFFTNNTNTFFEPYVQTTYDDTIEDDRASFYLDKPNKLYFYANIGGNSVNLDTLPTCTIEETGKTYQAIQQSKGVYYVNYRLNSSNVTAPTTYRDTWGGIYYGGMRYPDVELRFTTKSPSEYFQFGLPFDTERSPRYKVTLSGINRNEKVPQGETRRLTAHVRAEYTSDQENLSAKVDYRIYAMFDNKEIDVIDWQPVDKMYAAYNITLDTECFVPQVYHIDLRVKYGDETITQQDTLSFEIVSKADKMKS